MKILLITLALALTGCARDPVAPIGILSGRSTDSHLNDDAVPQEQGPLPVDKLRG